MEKQNGNLWKNYFHNLFGRPSLSQSTPHQNGNIVALLTLSSLDKQPQIVENYA